jgi:hypothetical protein
LKRLQQPRLNLLMSLTPSKKCLQTHSTSDSWRHKAAYSATQKLAPPPYPAHVHILQKPTHQEQHVKKQTANGQVLWSDMLHKRHASRCRTFYHDDTVVHRHLMPPGGISRLLLMMIRHMLPC